MDKTYILLRLDTFEACSLLIVVEQESLQLFHVGVGVVAVSVGGRRERAELIVIGASSFSYINQTKSAPHPKRMNLLDARQTSMDICVPIS